MANHDLLVRDIGSAYGSPLTIEALCAGQLRKRLLLLRMLLSEVDSHAAEDGRQAALRDAFEDLVAAQRQDPQAVRALLLYPNLGVWLSHCLRRIRSADGVEPLWPDLGYLGWLAATYMIKAGAPGRKTVVVRHGAVLLPGFGLARLAGETESGHCVLHHEGGKLRFEYGPAELIVGEVLDPRWLPLRTVGWVPQPVMLDDIDPFRDLSDPYSMAHLNEPPPRLTDDQAAGWRHAFERAWQLLRDRYPAYAAPMEQGLRAIIPLTAHAPLMGASNTSFDAFGCVNMSAPGGPHQFALTLIHEFQHAKLAALTDQVQLHRPDATRNLYAPWRDDPRPLSGLLQGIYAHVGVTDFWRIHRHDAGGDSVMANVEFARWRSQVDRALQEAAASDLLTDSGRDFVNALTAAVRPWADEKIPAEAAAIAREFSLAHWVAWRVRNLRVNEADLAELRRCWHDGQAAGVLPTATLAEPSGIPTDFQGRLLPTYAKLLGSDPGQIAQGTAGRSADAVYADGDFTGALFLYLRELEAQPGHPRPWAGVALCLSQTHPDLPLRALLDRGEVVAGVYQAVVASGGTCDVPDLIGWLSSADD